MASIRKITAASLCLLFCSGCGKGLSTLKPSAADSSNLGSSLGAKTVASESEVNIGEQAYLVNMTLRPAPAGYSPAMSEAAIAALPACSGAAGATCASQSALCRAPDKTILTCGSGTCVTKGRVVLGSKADGASWWNAITHGSGIADVNVLAHTGGNVNIFDEQGVFTDSDGVFVLKTVGCPQLVVARKYGYAGPNTNFPLTVSPWYYWVDAKNGGAFSSKYYKFIASTVSTKPPYPFTASTDFMYDLRATGSASNGLLTMWTVEDLRDFLEQTPGNQGSLAGNAPAPSANSNPISEPTGRAPASTTDQLQSVFRQYREARSATDGQDHTYSNSSSLEGGFDTVEGEVFKSSTAVSANASSQLYVCSRNTPTGQAHFASLDSTCEGFGQGKSLGFISRNPGPGKKQIHRCYSTQLDRHVLTISPESECTATSKYEIIEWGEGFYGF